METERRPLSAARWFSWFAVYAAAMAVLVHWLWTTGRAPLAQLAGFALVVSCACQFCPIQIIPLFLWIGRSWNPFLVALVGSAATAVANLHDYYVLTALLRVERIDRVRGTASYRRAAEWFARWPFWTLVASNIVVLPVDVPRLLAISTRYSRPRFVLATLVGRYPRYLLLAGLGYQLKPSNRQILAVLAALAAVWVLKRVCQRLRTGRRAPEGGAE